MTTIFPTKYSTKNTYVKTLYSLTYVKTLCSFTYVKTLCSFFSGEMKWLFKFHVERVYFDYIAIMVFLRQCICGAEKMIWHLVINPFR